MSLGILGFLMSGAAQASREATILQRGQYLVRAGGCVTCHTADRPLAIPLAGGRALPTPFGTFYPPNLTPDLVTGLGGWSDADFGRALREGRSPKGDYYYPVFPYPSYTGMSNRDVAAIAAYLRSLKPVRQPRQAPDLPWYLASRQILFGWNFLNFNSGRFVPDPAHSTVWNRGAYLVRHLGHCGECHTPRNALGAVDQNRPLEGNPEGPDGKGVPNITQNQTGGIGKWSVDELLWFLEVGMLPNGDFAGGSMSKVIEDNTGQLAATDRQAIATYLESIKRRPAP